MSTLQDRLAALIAVIGPDIKALYTGVFSALIPPTNTQAGNYTLLATDGVGVLSFTSASACTLTIPPNSSVALPIGTMQEGVQYGAGQLTIVPGAGVTIRSASGLKVSAQYGVFCLRKIGTNEWLAYGKLTP